MELNNNISIEQYAAFLDGNLPDYEMQVIEDAINSDKAYSDILCEVMQVDDVVDEYLDQFGVSPDVLPDMDFDLPIIPEIAKTPDVLDIAAVENMDSVDVELLKDDVHLTLASEETEIAAISPGIREVQLENPSLCDTFGMEHHMEDENDIIDLA